MMRIGDSLAASGGQAVAIVGFGDEPLADKLFEVVIIEVIGNIGGFHITVTQHIGVFEAGDNMVLDWRQLHAGTVRADCGARQAEEVSLMLVLIKVW